MLYLPAYRRATSAGQWRFVIGDGQGSLKLRLGQVGNLAELLGAVMGGGVDAGARPGGTAVILIEVSRVGQGVKLDIGKLGPQGRLAGAIVLSVG